MSQQPHSSSSRRRHGPAAVLPTAPAFTFGSRAAASALADRAPGPGTYEPRLTSASEFLSARTVGFGTANRLAPYGNRVPAPGEYDPRDALRPTSPACTFHGTTLKDVRARNPAPGQYNSERCVGADATHARSPALSMGALLPPPKSHARQPAPGEYSPYTASGRLPVTLKFRHERTITRVTATPGPGEYKLPSSLGGPAHSLGGRLQGSRQAEQVPGPADYGAGDSTIGVTVLAE